MSAKLRSCLAVVDGAVLKLRLFVETIDHEALRRAGINQ